MYRYSTTSQVVHAHDAANDISSQIVKDQDFPYWLPILYDGHTFREEATCIVLQVRTRTMIREVLGVGSIALDVLCSGLMVETEDFFYGRYVIRSISYEVLRYQLV